MFLWLHNYLFRCRLTAKRIMGYQILKSLQHILFRKRNEQQGMCVQQAMTDMERSTDFSTSHRAGRRRGA
jgi:hypothetical protein